MSELPKNPAGELGASANSVRDRYRFLAAATQPLRDLLRAHEQVRDKLTGTVLDALRVPEDASRLVAGRLQEQLRAHEQVRDKLTGTVLDALRVPEDASRLVAGRLQEQLRAHEQVRDKLTGTVLDALRVPEDASRLVAGRLQEQLRAHEQVRDKLTGTVLDAIRAQDEARRLVARSIAEAMRTPDEMYNSVFRNLTDVASTIKLVAELSGLAGQIGRMPRLATGLDMNAVMASALDGISEGGAEGQQAIPKEIFAEFDGDDYKVERAALRARLDKKVDGFDALPQTSKFVHLLDVVIESPTSAVGTFAFGVATNQLSGILDEADPQKLLARMYFLLLFMIFGAVAQLSKKLRVPKTRQILRTIPIDQQHSRIVVHTCLVSDRPKPKATKTGWLTIGAVVTVTDKFGGWRQIYFTGPEGRDRVGWVQSKYLQNV